MNRVIILFLSLFLFAGVCVADKKTPVNISDVKFSATRLAATTGLVVSCKIDGLRTSNDWVTLLVYRAEEGRDQEDHFVARDQVKWNFFKGRADQPMQLKASIDISEIPADGLYTVYLYGQTKEPVPQEFNVNIGSFKVDNSLMAGKSTPALLENPEKKIILRGLSCSENGVERFYEVLPSGKIFINVPGRDSSVEAVYQLSNNGKTTVSWGIDHLITDAFLRGERVRQEIALAPGEKKLFKAPVSQEQIDRFVTSNRSSGRREGKIMAKLQTKQGVIDTEQKPVFVFTSFEQASPVPAAHKRPAGVAAVKTDPVWGKLTLVDAVDCAAESPYRQGGKYLYTKMTSEPLAFYGSSRLNYDWYFAYNDTKHDKGFSEIKTILDRECRTAENWGWFSYILGKGKLEKGRSYVVEVDYPQDVSRSFAICPDENLHPGFHTGSSIGDPWTRQRFVGTSNLPLSGKYETWRGFIKHADPPCIVSVNSMGNRADPLSAGVAVSQIRIYKVETSQFPELKISYPEASLPRRMLVMLQEDMPPGNSDSMNEMKNYGINTYSPIALFYCGKGNKGMNAGYAAWNSNLFNPARYEIKKSPNALDQSLEEAATIGLDILPCFEYGGTSQLPEDAYAIEANGQKSRYYWGTTLDSQGNRIRERLKDWYCIDIAHPAVAADFCKILDEFRPVIEKYRNIKGIELAHRYNVWQISFSEYELNRFARETGVKMPDGDQRQKAQWVLNNALDQYWQFFYEKKREVMLSIRDKLKSIRPDLDLYVLNYIADDHLPFGQILHFWTKDAWGKYDEFIDPANPEYPCLPSFGDNTIAIPRLNWKTELSKLLEDYRRPDQDQPGISPPLYKNDKGIFIWAPVHYEFTANSPAYLNFFRTGAGLAVANFWIYNEDCWKNNPDAEIPGLGGTEHAGPFCMMEEVMAVAAADPIRLGIRIGYLKRGFPEYAREFAQAYLALPALPSEVIDAGVADKDVVVRRIATERGNYYAIINKGLSLETKEVSLHCFPLGTVFKDLVTGQTIAERQGEWKVKLSPMSLRSFIASDK